MDDQQNNMATSRWGDSYVHYPIGFDGGYVLDCQSCGERWPCAEATESARASAEKEAKRSTLVDSGS